MFQGAETGSANEYVNDVHRRQVDPSQAKLLKSRIDSIPLPTFPNIEIYFARGRRGVVMTANPTPMPIMVSPEITPVGVSVVLFEGSIDGDDSRKKSLHKEIP